QGFIIFDGLLPLLKSKVAISKGTVLCLHMFAVKVGEPKGIPPENMQNLVGKKIKVDMDKDDSILADRGRQ
uniref:AFP-like domain-containing protein n=1 Tax=Oreochromis niloticus TaxID=8128 RepID=A0A669CNS9_ORENI